VLNRAAEDAVKKPIFVDAVTNMCLQKRILMGNESSATNLQNSTSTALYGKFNPNKNSFTKVVLIKCGQTLLLNTIAFR
jgi:hypothetical protein